MVRGIRQAALISFLVLVVVWRQVNGDGPALSMRAGERIDNSFDSPVDSVSSLEDSFRWQFLIPPWVNTSANFGDLPWMTGP